MEQLKSMYEIEEFLHNNEQAILYFSSDECSVCHSVENQLQDLLVNFPHLKASKVKVPELMEVTGKYLIFTVPEMLFFLKGKEVFRQGRFFKFKELEEEIKNWYNN